MRPGPVLGAIALAAAAVYTVREMRTGRETERRNETEKRLFNVSPDEMTSVMIAGPEGTFRIERSQDGWNLTEPSPARADKRAASELVRNLSAAETIQIVEKNPDSADRYGLGASATRVTVRTAAGEETTVEVGIDAPTKDGVYARRAGSKEVLLAGTEMGEAARAQVEMIAERTLLPGAGGATGLVVTREGKRIALARNDAGWEMKEPFVFPAESSRIEELLASLSNLKLTPAGRIPSTPAAAGLDPPRVEIDCRFPAGQSKSISFGLEIPDNKTWVRRGDEQRIFMVETKPLALLLHQPVEEWCQALPTRLDRYRARSLSLRLAGSSLALTRAEAGWKDSSGREVPEQAALSLLASLFDCRTVGLEADPAGAPRGDAPLRVEARDDAGRTHVFEGWGPDAEGRWRLRPKGYRPALIVRGDYLETVRARLVALGR